MEMIQANKKDLPQIMELINQAKKFLKQQGVDQWQDGYPEVRNLEKDLQDGIGYVCKEGNRILAYAALDFRGEPAYETLKGQWLNQDPYVVIHRMAVDSRARGKGLAQQLFRQAEAMALARGVQNVRADTDEANAIMRHIIQKAGYTFCGHIFFANSDKIAFQKTLAGKNGPLPSTLSRKTGGNPAR